MPSKINPKQEAFKTLQHIQSKAKLSRKKFRAVEEVHFRTKVTQAASSLERDQLEMLQNTGNAS